MLTLLYPKKFCELETRKLSLQEMQMVEGGNLADGACAVLGLTDVGLAVRFLVGASLAIPGWGLTLLAVGTVACGTYAWLK